MTPDWNYFQWLTTLFESKQNQPNNDVKKWRHNWNHNKLWRKLPNQNKQWRNNNKIRGAIWWPKMRNGWTQIVDPSRSKNKYAIRLALKSRGHSIIHIFDITLEFWNQVCDFGEKLVARQCSLLIRRDSKVASEDLIYYSIIIRLLQ